MSVKSVLSSLKQSLLRLRAAFQKLLCCQIPLRYLRAVKFPHPVGIVIGDGVRIGNRVRIYQNVTIGRIANEAGAHQDAYPRLEDDVLIYAGAVICGGITIGARSVVGANALITRDVPPDSVAFGYNQCRSRELAEVRSHREPRRATRPFTR